MREPDRGKLSVCFGGELAEENCECGVCALRVGEVTPFSLKENSIYLTLMLAWSQNW